MVVISKLRCKVALPNLSTRLQSAVRKARFLTTYQACKAIWALIDADELNVLAVNFEGNRLLKKYPTNKLSFTFRFWRKINQFIRFRRFNQRKWKRWPSNLLQQWIIGRYGSNTVILFCKLKIKFQIFKHFSWVERSNIMCLLCANIVWYWN